MEGVWGGGSPLGVPGEEGAWRGAGQGQALTGRGPAVPPAPPSARRPAAPTGPRAPRPRRGARRGPGGGRRSRGGAGPGRGAQPDRGKRGGGRLRGAARPRRPGGPGWGSAAARQASPAPPQGARPRGPSQLRPGYLSPAPDTSARPRPPPPVPLERSLWGTPPPRSCHHPSLVIHPDPGLLGSIAPYWALLGPSPHRGPFGVHRPTGGPSGSPHTQPRPHSSLSTPQKQNQKPPSPSHARGAPLLPPAPLATPPLTHPHGAAARWHLPHGETEARQPAPAPRPLRPTAPALFPQQIPSKQELGLPLSPPNPSQSTKP